jgi:hypothetical protein
MNVPDAVSPVRGWRMWGVTADGLLQSTAAGWTLPRMPEWRPHERFDARCLAARSCGAAPRPSHGCGVYAFTAREDAERWACSIARGRAGDIAVGEVLGWGRVVECERGWRAQYAYPASLDSPALAVRYAVRVIR